MNIRERLTNTFSRILETIVCDTIPCQVDLSTWLFLLRTLIIEYLFYYNIEFIIWRFNYTLNYTFGFHPTTIPFVKEVLTLAAAC